MLHRTAALLVLAMSSGCAAGSLESDAEDVDEIEEGVGPARHKVKADVDLGGGVLLANRPGGFYMGRLLVGQSFDRHGGWYFSEENQTSYAWAMAWGHSNACLWVGPSRGKIGFPAGTWATPGAGGQGERCSPSQKSWLQEGDAKNIGSHFNCPPPTASAHGTEKVLIKDAPLYWNVSWEGGAMGYDGGPLRDFATTIPAGTHVWYRYTTRDGQRIVAFVPAWAGGSSPSASSIAAAPVTGASRPIRARSRGAEGRRPRRAAASR